MIWLPIALGAGELVELLIAHRSLHLLGGALQFVPFGVSPRLAERAATAAFGFGFGWHGANSHLLQMNAHASKRVRELAQTDLFGAPATGSAGFRYQPDLVTAEEEIERANELARLPFEPFDFHGHLAHRHVVGFGYRYDYGSRTVRKAAPIPTFLEPLRSKVAAFAGQPPEAFEQVLINAYRPGAGIGWHRDKPHFEEVVGVSLLAPCTFRFRKQVGERWERMSLPVDPRSAYLMTGPSRHVWEHSIPPLEQPRYSITMRTLAAST